MKELLSRILGDNPRYLWIAVGALAALPFCIWLGSIILSDNAEDAGYTVSDGEIVQNNPYEDFFSVDALMLPDIWSELTSFKHIKVREAGESWSQKEVSRWWDSLPSKEDDKDAGIDSDVDKLLESIR